MKILIPYFFETTENTTSLLDIFENKIDGNLRIHVEWTKPTNLDVLGSLIKIEGNDVLVWITEKHIQYLFPNTEIPEILNSFLLKDFIKIKDKKTKKNEEKMEIEDEEEEDNMDI